MDETIVKVGSSGGGWAALAEKLEPSFVCNLQVPQGCADIMQPMPR